MKTEHRIADYDKAGYKYEKYWTDQAINRAYEDLAERLAISRMIPDSGNWFLDLGAGYGRLADLYVNRFLNVIIADYSLENLKKAQIRLGNQTLGSQIHFVALNAYHLPFKNEALDAVMMVRVLHHLEEPEDVLSEVFRILSPDGALILEFSNKRHLLEIFRGIFGASSLNPFSFEPEMRGDLFYNFHPEFIRRLLKKIGFEKQRWLSVSNLRHRIFKKLLGVRIMKMLESSLQKIFAYPKLGPSIFVRSQKPVAKNVAIPAPTLQDLLCCPNCSIFPLTIYPNEIVCPNCNKSYHIVEGIYDLRIS